ncbi:MAG TPA: hypothetical protein VNI83_11380, partial [Vicinamibacterales bacterium]|nr:hypothetical protein [Vicinamibacterales bacterium]
AEIAAEEARLQQGLEAERRRLLDQMRRELELRARIARRELVAEAADLVVRAALDRIRRAITIDDQLRLVDRYAALVGSGVR